jgi:hypothetical protein
LYFLKILEKSRRI